MPAYVITEIEVTDPKSYEGYKSANSVIVASFGGRFLARGSDIVSLEGNWRPERLVIIEFRDTTTARAWWNSDAYCEAKNLRQRSTVTKMLIIAGCQQTT